MRAALFHDLDRALSAALTAIRVVHEGVWLGMMGHQALDRATELYYRRRPRYRDPGYNASGLKAWEERAIERSFGDCRSVLVGAAGGGREVLALASRGLRVLAFERSRELRESCRELVAGAGLDAEVVGTGAGQAPPGGERVDGLIVGWGAYMHIPGRVARVLFLRQLRDRVRDGGPLLLSFFTRDRDSRRDLWIQRIGQAVRGLRLSREPVEIGDSLSGSFDHYFTRAEIEAELAAADFRLDRYETEPFGHAVGIAV